MGVGPGGRSGARGIVGGERGRRLLLLLLVLVLLVLVLLVLVLLVLVLLSCCC